MDIEKTNDKNVEIKVSSSDVESAVRQFICSCHPELATGWVINPKTEYKLGFMMYSATKND
jgi:hypothetical protein